MVDPTPPTPQSSKPFALRAVIYTIGFLLVVLGVIPSLFYLAGELPFHRIDFSTEVRLFWLSFMRLCGMAVFAGGFVAYALCSAWLIFHGRGPHVEFDPPKIFVASGPYRWVRNPVVICLIITAAGEALYFASIGIAVFTLLGMAFAQYQVTKIEEPRLRNRFGETYENYCSRVPRWLPRPPRD